MKHAITILIAVIAVFALVNLSVAAADQPAKKVPLKLMPAGKALIKEGVEFKSEDYRDIDLDGKDEAVLILDRKGDKTLEVYHLNAAGLDYDKVFSYPFKEGYTLDRLEIDDLARIGRPQLTLWLKDESSPDEKGISLSIHGFDGSYKTMFEYTYFMPRKGSATEKGSTPVVFFGPVNDELKFSDEEGDGRMEIVLPAQRRTIEVTSKSGGKVIYVIGARYEVYKYSDGEFKKLPTDKVVSFISKQLPIKTVEASSSEIDKKTKEVTNPPEWTADGNIGSSWLPGGKKDGVGESIKVWLEDRVPIKALIVIPGCMDGPESWDQNNVVQAFTIEFSGGETVKVDRKDLTLVEPPAAGAKEMARQETKNSSQILILFKEGLQSRNVKLTIDQVVKGPKGAKTCIPEINVF